MLSVTLFSCKKNADYDDPYIESVAGESAKEESSDNTDTPENTVQEENAPAQNTEPDKIKPEEEKSAQSQNQEQVTTTTSPDEIQIIKPSQNTQMEEEPEADDSYFEEEEHTPFPLSKIDIYAKNPRIYGWLSLGYTSVHPQHIMAENNGIKYYYYPNGDGFPKYTIYENYDMSQLKPTGETVSIQHEVANEYGKLEYQHLETGEIYELNDQLKSDPFIDFLALKRESGQIVLFYNAMLEERNALIDDKTFYREFLRYNRVSGSECLDASNVDAVLLTYISWPDFKTVKQVTLTGDDSTEFYTKYTQLELDKEDKSIKFDFSLYISFRFKDGTRSPAQQYIPDQRPNDIGFNEYILSLLK